jgi:hypothetical protein
VFGISPVVGVFFYDLHPALLALSLCACSKSELGRLCELLSGVFIRVSIHAYFRVSLLVGVVVR